MNKEYYWKDRKVMRKDRMTKEEFVKKIREEKGKKVIVDGSVFDSIGSAAKYICDNSEGRFETIKKEIQRMVNGKRKFGIMYRRFEICEYV